MCFHGTIRLGEQATRERRLLFLIRIEVQMKLNEVFYFQTVEIQWFAKGEINCDYLLISAIVCNFANKISPCL